MILIISKIKIMNTTESFDGSLGVDSFLTPHKQASLETMGSSPSLQYSNTKNQTIGFDTLSKLITYNSVEASKQYRHCEAVPEEDSFSQDRYQKLLNLQSWVLGLYKMSRAQKQTYCALSRNIEEKEHQNKIKKSFLKYQKDSIEDMSGKYKKLKAKMKKKEQNEFQKGLEQIQNARQRIFNLEDELQKLEDYLNKKRNRKGKSHNHHKKRKVHENPLNLINGHHHGYHHHDYHDYQRYLNSPMVGSQSGDSKNMVYSNTNPLLLVENHFINQQSSGKIIPPKNSSLENRPEPQPAFTGNFGDMLGQALLKKMQPKPEETNNKKNPIEPELRNSKRLRSVQSSSKMSKNWDNCDEEKDIIDIMGGSKKENSRYLSPTDNKPKHRMEESQVNVFVEESEASKFSLQKRKRDFHLTSLKQSKIQLQLPDDESYSKSGGEISIEKHNSSDDQKTRKKSPSFNQSPTFNFNPELAKKSNSGIVLHKISEKNNSLNEGSKTNPVLLEKKSKKEEKKKSGDIEVKEMVIDQNNLGQSVAASKCSPPTVNYQTLESPKLDKSQERKLTDPNDDDDDELFSINLLAVSKISKEKEESLKKTISEDGEDNRVRSSVLMKKSKKASPQTSRKKKMTKIIEEEFELPDEEKEKQRSFEEKRRKNSGRYSLILEQNNANIEFEKGEGGKSHPTNELN